MGRKNVYERFIWFDKEARSGKYPNASKLAGRFEVSNKTAQRDIDFMRDRLRCPMEYDKSRKGYYYEDSTFTLPSIFLSSEELSSLLIARKVLLDISGGNLANGLSSIIDKLTSFIDSHSRETLHIDSVISLKHIEYMPVDDRIFRSVLDGCLEKRCLRLRYRGLGDAVASPRVVNPYHLFSYKGTWHLLAYCHKRESIRDFVLGRITSVAHLDKTFNLPNDFDPEDYFSGAFGLFRGTTKKRVVLRFSPDAAGRVIGQVWHEKQEERFLKEGSYELSFSVEKLTEVKSEVLKYGSLVEVIKPDELRELVRTEAREIERLYKK